MLSDQLGFKLLDLDFFNTLLRLVFSGKCSGSVFEKLLLPDVENLRLKLISVTQVGYSYVLDQG